MIQRIQSVYLLLGALCIASLAFIDSVWRNLAGETIVWYVPVLAVLAAVTVIMALTTLFLYKNRLRQIKLIVAVQLMTIGVLLILLIGLLLSGELEMLRGGTADWTRLLPFLLPVVAYALFYLARRGVQRDIDLVKSMDRLR